jgi:peroxiredoxin
VACEELLVELQERQTDFEERDAELVVLGSLPEPMDVAKREAERRGITYTLLHDARTSVTKNVGLWSDHMEMPWMGYLIIDKSGRVVASELVLSEAKGAAPENVDTILAALDDVRQLGTAEPNVGQ